MKDWTGNKKTSWTQLGASNHSEVERPEHDYYATPPTAVEDLLSKESFNNVWEPACGEGHISKVLQTHGILSRSTDLICRGYGDCEQDFFSFNEMWDGDIITNPPYRFAKEFVEKSLTLIEDGHKVAMLLKVQFLESKKRMELFKNNPPKRIYIWSGRMTCALNGDFESIKHGSPMMFAWFVWDKGFVGDPIIKWIELC